MKQLMFIGNFGVLGVFFFFSFLQSVLHVLTSLLLLATLRDRKLQIGN